jgi:hypothetical protein
MVISCVEVISLSSSAMLMIRSPNSTPQREVDPLHEDHKVSRAFKEVHINEP